MLKLITKNGEVSKTACMLWVAFGVCTLSMCGVIAKIPMDEMITYLGLASGTYVTSNLRRGNAKQHSEAGQD